MDRVVQSEWLDELPADHPGAEGSRRDLRRLNAWMGNAANLARALRRQFKNEPPSQILDLGAGDGRLMFGVARQLVPYWRNVTAVLLDRQDSAETLLRADFERLGWGLQMVQQDVIEFLKDNNGQGWDAVIANLFLHHFAAGQLRELLGLAARRARLFVAIEPRRSPRSLLFSRLVWLLGCNGVTRHDAPVSVRAGFRGAELSRLWPANALVLEERPAGLFSHLFVARGVANEGA